MDIWTILNATITLYDAAATANTTLNTSLLNIETRKNIRASIVRESEKAVAKPYLENRDEQQPRMLIAYQQ